MPRTKKIKDNPDLIKDTTSQAVINTNRTAIQARRAQIAQNKQKEEELQTMKDDIAEIKSLLKKLGSK
jgi:cell shape-determining protein MreC